MKTDILRTVRLSRKAKVGLAAIVSLFICWSSTVNYLDPGEAGLTWNPVTGQITVQDVPGWQLNSPLTFVTTIDLRPQRLCLTSSAHAAVNCQLVEFNIEHYREFIEVEGWRWYWWSNRFSFNFGHQETYRGWRDVLRGYAFSSKRYKFITVQATQ